MKSCLDLVQHRVTPGHLDQLIMGPVLDQAPRLDRQDAIGVTHRGEAVRDNEDCAAGADLAHVALNDALALIVEG